MGSTEHTEPMSTVTIRRPRPARASSTEELTFIGWKADRSAFYAMSGREVAVITMTPVSPEGAKWAGGPFPDSAPVHVGPVHLVAPPCRLNEEGWKKSPPKGWEAAYLATHHVGLHLEPEDGPAIERFLEGYRKLKRAEYRWLSKEARGIAKRSDRVGRLKELALDYLDQFTNEDGVEIRGHAKANADMVRHGIGRDSHLWKGFLFSVWMQQVGVTESEMLRERIRLREWLRARAHYLARVFGPKPTNSRTTVPVEFNGDTDPEFLETCARVRLSVAFLDGSTAYLSGITTRGLTAEEADEVWELYGIEADTEAPRARTVSLDHPTHS